MKFLLQKQAPLHSCNISFETRAKTDIRKRAKDKMIMEGNMNQKGDVLELKLFQKR